MAAPVPHVPTTLVIEDDPAFMYAVTEHLGRNGIAADSAGSIAAALTKLAAGKYCSIVLDLKLPDGNGVELIDRLTAAGPSLPIIVVTGASREELEPIDPAIVPILFRKPFDIALLVTVVRALCEAHKRAAKR